MTTVTPVEEATPHYAGFWIRWSACLIDSSLISVMAIVGTLAVLGFWFWAERWGVLKAESSTTGVAIQSLGVALYGIFSFLYMTLAHWRFGTTVGKVVFRIYVQDERTGGRPTLRQSTVRAAGSWLSWICGVGYLMAAWSPRKRALHDHLAGTVSIIRPARKWVFAPTAKLALGLLLCLVLIPVAQAEEDLPSGRETPAWAARSGRGPFPQFAVDLATGAQGAAGVEFSASALFAPFANPWTFLGPRAAYWIAGREGSPRRDVSFGAEWSLWLLNAAGPGLAVDYVLPENGRGGRLKFEPWLALRVKRVGTGGALSARVGVVYDSGDKWGFRLGLLFQSAGVFNLASAVIED